MVPITSGRFRDGIVPRKPDEQPVHKVRVDAFWMQAHEVTWDEYRLFMFANQAGESGAQGRSGGCGQSSYAALCGDELRHGHQRLPGHQHDPARRQQIRRMAQREDRRVLPAADGSRMGICLSRRHARDGSSFRLGDYAWYCGEQQRQIRKGRERRSRTPGVFSTCWATSWNGRSMPTLPYKAGRQVESLGEAATQPYPMSVRGGSWNDPADAVSCCRACCVRCVLEAAGSAAAEEYLVLNRRAVAGISVGPASENSYRRGNVSSTGTTASNTMSSSLAARDGSSHPAAPALQPYEAVEAPHGHDVSHQAVRARSSAGAEAFRAAFDRIARSTKRSLTTGPIAN